MKDKNFENYLEKNNNLSRASLSLRTYGYQLINRYVNLDSKIIEFKKLEDPDEEMEEFRNKLAKKLLISLSFYSQFRILNHNRFTIYILKVIN